MAEFLITNNPKTPKSGRKKLFPKSDGSWYEKDSSGIVSLFGFNTVDTAPANANSAGQVGDMYGGPEGTFLCVAVNTWVKLATSYISGVEFTLVTEPAVYETTNSGLNLSNIPDFTMKSDWFMCYDMLRAYETRLTTIELTKGFKLMSHYRLGTDGIYDTTPTINRIGFLNMQTIAADYFTGDPYTGDNINLDISGNTAKWVTSASVLDYGTNGLVYDIERWDWGGDGTYQERIADVHTLIFKTGHEILGNDVNSTKKPLICWGPYAPIELPSADSLYDNLAGGVNVSFTTYDRNEELWHDYATHILVGMYYRSDDAADGFKLKMYKNILCFDANTLYDEEKKKVAMVYLHEENNNTVLLPTYVAEFQAIMPAMCGATGYYCWAEAGYAEINDGRNWNTYKKFILALKRLSAINNIFSGTNLEYHLWETEFSVNGGSTYIKPKPIYSHTNSLPVVRSIKSENGIAIACCNPFASDGDTTNIKVKIDSIVYDVVCTGKQTSLYYKYS